MSFSRPPKKGKVAANTFGEPLAGDALDTLPGLVGDLMLKNDQLKVFIDNSAGDVVIDPAVALAGIPGVENSDQVIFCPVGDGGCLQFTDPVTGAEYNYADQLGESLCLCYTEENGWGFEG